MSVLKWLGRAVELTELSTEMNRPFMPNWGRPGSPELPLLSSQEHWVVSTGATHPSSRHKSSRRTAHGPLAGHRRAARSRRAGSTQTGLPEKGPPLNWASPPRERRRTHSPCSQPRSRATPKHLKTTDPPDRAAAVRPWRSGPRPSVPRDQRRPLQTLQ